MALESKFKSELIAEIKRQFPGAVVLKTDANQIQGIPDQLILWGSRWAAFEAKRSMTAPHQPNQDYYVGLFDQMSFARFVYPENEEVFLYELQQAFRTRRRARVSVGI
jgi:hypothetical protein